MARKMNPEVKKLWVKSLRSGKIKQARGCLYSNRNKNYSLCCLGVLCDIHRKCTKSGRKGLALERYQASGNGVLPANVARWAGLASKRTSVIIKSGKSLVNYNDDLNYNFKQIADVIEEKL